MNLSTKAADILMLITGKNTKLGDLRKIAKDIKKDNQLAMNFTAGWIGVFEKQFRNRCITLGEKTGLYNGQMVSKGCTPDYLPEFISIESKKRNL